MTLHTTLALAALLASCAPTAPPEPRSNASSLLRNAARSAHNGGNPTIEVSDDRLRLVLGPLEDAVDHGSCGQRRDAASLLGRLHSQRDLRPFWLRELGSRDVVVRFWAMEGLAGLADPQDLEPVLRQAVAAPQMMDTLAALLRNWHDRRAVPALIEMLDGPELVRGNAAISLSLLPFCPHLEPDPVGPAEHQVAEGGQRYWTQATDAAAPYRRWWAERGAREFVVEQAWWVEWKRTITPDAGLVSDAPCSGS